MKWILKNPVYAGEVKWGDVSVTGTHTPLVALGEWLAVQECLKRRSTSRLDTTTGTPIERAGHYTPLLRCGQSFPDGEPCGSDIGVSSPQVFGGNRVVYYFCRRRLEYIPEERHPLGRISEGLFVQMLYRHTEVLFTEGSVAEAAAKVGNAPAGRGIAEARARLDELARLRRINVQSLQRGLITEDDLQNLNGPLMAEEAELRERLDHSTDTGFAELLRQLSGLSLPRLLEQLREKPIGEQVVTFKQLYPRIELLPGALRFHHAQNLPPIERQIPAYRGPRTPRELDF